MPSITTRTTRAMKAYLLTKGIDVLTGISRFWADRVHFSKRKQKYMIHGVTGPNEYENNVNNNYHTNNMAPWTLEYTLESLAKVSDDKLAELAVSEEETEHWQDIVDQMYYPHDEKLGVFVQHDTFLDKDIRHRRHAGSHRKAVESALVMGQDSTIPVHQTVRCAAEHLFPERPLHMGRKRDATSTSMNR